MIEFLEEIDSTNSELKRRASQRALPSGTIIAARQQHSGRGRLDRTWQSLDGNLMASMIWHPEQQSPALWPTAAMVTSLALHNVLVAYLPSDARLEIKWPNDLLLNGKKLGGILLESQKPFFISGFGINLHHAPENTPYPAIALRDIGIELSVDTLLPLIQTTLAHHFSEWDRFGLAAWLPELHALWAARGKQVQLISSTNTEPLQGTFIDVAEDGALLLQTASGLQRIVTGDMTPSLRWDGYAAAH